MTAHRRNVLNEIKMRSKNIYIKMLTLGAGWSWQWQAESRQVKPGSKRQISVCDSIWWFQYRHPYRKKKESNSTFDLFKLHTTPGTWKKYEPMIHLNQHVKVICITMNHIELLLTKSKLSVWMYTITIRFFVVFKSNNHRPTAAKMSSINLGNL